MLHIRAHQYATAKVYVSSDSVLRLRRIGDELVESGKNMIQWYSETNCLSELNQVDGEPMEFEWKIFQDSQQRASSRRFRIRWANQCDPADFKDRIIFV